MNIRYIIKTLGSILILETCFLLIATCVALCYGGNDVWPLALSSGIMLGAGILFYGCAHRAKEYEAGKREGMLTVTLTWIVLSFFGMLPFYLGGYVETITDAYFETMSGFTTTGSTIFDDVESLPHGILFWRSLIQWQGGIGMVVFTVALLPMFGGGASMLFDAETTGVTHERFRPRVTQVAKRLSGIYIFITCTLILLLWIGPMNLFDAVNHALTCVSTGGYSTKNESIGYWKSAYIEYIIMLFMCFGGVNITLLFFAFRGKTMRLLRDDELRWFLAWEACGVLIRVGWLLYNGYATGTPDVEHTFRPGQLDATR